MYSCVREFKHPSIGNINGNINNFQSMMLMVRCSYVVVVVIMYFQWSECLVKYLDRTGKHRYQTADWNN